MHKTTDLIQAVSAPGLQSPHKKVSRNPPHFFNLIQANKTRSYLPIPNITTTTSDSVYVLGASKREPRSIWRSQVILFQSREHDILSKVGLVGHCLFDREETEILLEEGDQL